MSEIGEGYERRRPALRRAEDRLRSILEAVVATIEDKTLVRAEVRSVRTKELSSLERKAEKNGWNADVALAHCGDLIGGRVVCNNIEDIYRFAELLKERLPTPSGDFELEDYTTQPSEGGYRALHVNFRLDVGEHPFLTDLVPCEVQIRSRLQEAWAELSHDDNRHLSSVTAPTPEVMQRSSHAATVSSHCRRFGGVFGATSLRADYFRPSRSICNLICRCNLPTFSMHDADMSAWISVSLLSTGVSHTGLLQGSDRTEQRSD